ncbi:hypothetical protein QNA08_13320 [Chelatococcus sp. SYSU_G07232]|uniref:Uncharacterized protein n=1 Tax=Chelatococcus albus TaxID=3047466 RepID=A0ABT7AIL0_9HYPH|nr:hypothetical protein [Chelatococcus sp. SYSU_G07232]MDJ1159216.1 hypothetical protein [Chelatococcus sp. SYSU_G07232]
MRFDLYENSAKGLRNDPNFTPAPNVRKGYATKPSATDGICLNSNKDVVYDPDQPPSKQPNAPAIGFPREPCFYAGTCSPVSTTGTWEWDIDTYWAVNHPTEPCKSKKSQVWDGAGPKPSRYFVYQKELELDCVSDRSKGDAGGQMKETGSKTCSKQPAGGAERRILYAAVIDCSKVSGGTSTPMAVEAFAKFFITEPVHNPSDPVIWAEFIGIVEPGTDKSVARDNVQLYR